MIKIFTNFFRTNISEKHFRDTGLALLLILQIYSYFTGKYDVGLVSIVIILIIMVYPKLLKPLAFVWFGFSEIMGTLVSKLILTLIYIFLVTPVGLIRKIFGIDSLKLKDFKKDTKSVFVTRNKQFTDDDLRKPF